MSALCNPANRLSVVANTMATRAAAAATVGQAATAAKVESLRKSEALLFKHAPDAAQHMCLPSGGCRAMLEASCMAFTSCAGRKKGRAIAQKQLRGLQNADAGRIWISLRNAPLQSPASYMCVCVWVVLAQLVPGIDQHRLLRLGAGNAAWIHLTQRAFGRRRTQAALEIWQEMADKASTPSTVMLPPAKRAKTGDAHAGEEAVPVTSGADAGGKAVPVTGGADAGEAAALAVTAPSIGAAAAAAAADAPAAAAGGAGAHGASRAGPASAGAAAPGAELRVDPVPATAS